MPMPTDENRLNLARQVIQTLDDQNGVHPGHRPAHAKGILTAGTFTPTSEAASLSRAPHFHAPSTPVTIRFSDFAGFPTPADNDPNQSSPRGCATRFHLGEHAHTDIVAHSADGFPVRTAPEFVEFLGAIRASGPDAPHPNPIEQFLGSHPKALAFVQLPKPIPTSFARESYFSVTAYKFIDAAGATRHVRYRILPDAGNEYLSRGRGGGERAKLPDGGTGGAARERPGQDEHMGSGCGGRRYRGRRHRALAGGSRGRLYWVSSLSRAGFRTTTPKSAGSSSTPFRASKESNHRPIHCWSPARMPI